MIHEYFMLTADYPVMHLLGVAILICVATVLICTIILCALTAWESIGEIRETGDNFIHAFVRCWKDECY